MLFGPVRLTFITVYVVSLEIGKYFWCPSKPTFDLHLWGWILSYLVGSLGFSVNDVCKQQLKLLAIGCSVGVKTSMKAPNQMHVCKTSDCHIRSSVAGIVHVCIKTHIFLPFVINHPVFFHKVIHAVVSWFIWGSTEIHLFLFSHIQTSSWLISQHPRLAVGLSRPLSRQDMSACLQHTNWRD